MHRHNQGLRHADENGGGTGTRRQRIQDFRQRQPIPKTENSADLAHYFPENGGDYPPLSQKWGGRVPPVPPCGGAPGHNFSEDASKTSAWPLGFSCNLQDQPCGYILNEHSSSDIAIANKLFAERSSPKLHLKKQSNVLTL